MLPSRRRGAGGPGPDAGPATGPASTSIGAGAPECPAASGGSAPRVPAWRWALRLGGAACYLIAALANAPDLVSGRQPSVAGVAWSGLYLAAWLACAVRAGRSRTSRQLRWIAVFWAVVVAATVLFGTFLRLNLGTGVAIPGGWVVPAAMLVVAAPLYGLVGVLHAEPLRALLGVALGAAALTMGLAVAARRLRPVPVG